LGGVERGDMSFSTLYVACRKKTEMPD
jgi:hypothetical protein